MGLFQKAYDTYINHENLVGQDIAEREMLSPISHMVTRADIEITLNANGEFVSARTVDKSEPKVIIPVTEGSSGRTIAPCPHPLCDQIGYLSSHNSTKHDLYLKELEAWCSSSFTHKKVTAVYEYIKKDSIISDLTSNAVIKLNEDGLPEDDKKLVVWRVLDGSEQTACWKDVTLFNAYISYYNDSMLGEKTLCMITGEMGVKASQHPKGVVSLKGNAKLISSNDKENFTYKGRFLEDSQACSIGYGTSQKFHSALKWLVTEQGFRDIYGGRTFVCWNPKGKKVVLATGPFFKHENVIVEPTDYKNELSKCLMNYKAELPVVEEVVIAALDAATTGRLAVTYYNELMASDFLQRLYDWDSSCCWWNGKFGIQSPPLRRIIECAYGVERVVKGNSKFDVDERIMAQQMQRMLSCRVDRAIIPFDIVKNLSQKVSNLIRYEKANRELLLFVTCAILRKFYYYLRMEDVSMELDVSKVDRSYQYGRLLAVLEKAERDSYGENEDRETNAMRLQSVYCQKPLTMTQTIEKQLEKAYFPRLKSGKRAYYKNLIGDILCVIHGFPESEWNKPLKDNYIMGYYLQRKDLYTYKSSKNVTEEVNENE